MVNLEKNPTSVSVTRWYLDIYLLRYPIESFQDLQFRKVHSEDWSRDCGKKSNKQTEVVNASHKA